MQLKDPRPTNTSRMRLPGNPRPIAVICISQPKRMWKARTMWLPCSAPPRKARPDTRTAIWNTWKPAATPPPTCPSEPPAQPEIRDRRRDPRVHRHVSAAWSKTARAEGFDEIADWFETLAKAERSHANRFQKALDALTD